MVKESADRLAKETGCTAYYTLDEMLADPKVDIAAVNLPLALRLEKGGRLVNGQGADTDIVIASAKAYINGCNKLLEPAVRAHPQVGDV